MYPDIEAVFPFQVLALIVWPSGYVHGYRRMLLACAVVTALAQPMILTRTFDKTDGPSRLKYFAVNELYAFVSIALIFFLQDFLRR